MTFLDLLAPGELPKTTSGKVHRQKSRALYLAGTLGTGWLRAMRSPMR